MSLLSLVRRGHLPCANGPDWLASQHNACPILLTECVRQGLQLRVQHIEGGATLSSLKLLADASDALETSLNGELGLLCDDHICLAAVLAALTVAQDDPLESHLLQHLRRDLAGPCTLRLVPQVLCCNGVLLAKSLRDFRKEDEGWRANDLDVLGEIHGDLTSIQVLHKCCNHVWSAIGLPVATDDELTSHLEIAATSQPTRGHK
mmetsp:Transcript_719/g.1023  ORF Transcript_719/g.1023 Transcript_719/m.1023 type:complete len:205 (+) Transcript_719:352-966(+)